MAHSRFALIDADGRRCWWPSRTGSATPSPPLEPGRDVRREVDAPRLPRLQLDRADPALRGAGGRVPARRTAPPFDFAFWLRMAESLGRRVHRRGAVPLPDPRAELHVRAERRDRHRLPAGRAVAARGARRQAPARGDAAAGRATRRAGAARRPRRCGRTSSPACASARCRSGRSSPTVRGLGGAARREPCAAARAAPRGRCSPAASSVPATVDAAKGSCVGPRRPRRR